MTVSELIALLEGCGPDPTVRIMSQEGWPFENAIAGVAVREDFLARDCDCDHRINEAHDQGCPAEDAELPEGCAANDVFIVEGNLEVDGQFPERTPVLLGECDHPRLRSTESDTRVAIIVGRDRVILNSGTAWLGTASNSTEEYPSA